MKLTTEQTARFWQKVKIRRKGCWIWIAGKLRDGYGEFAANGKLLRAHRVSFECYKGEIPFGLCVCHSCDNRLCVNPAHLFLGTKADNAADMARKGRNLFGMKNHNAKLTDSRVKEIRSIHVKGLISIAEIARGFGVSHRCISDIVNRKTWRHIPIVDNTTIPDHPANN